MSMRRSCPGDRYDRVEVFGLGIEAGPVTLLSPVPYASNTDAAT